MKKDGIFFGHLKYITAIWYIFWPFGNLLAVWHLFSHFGICMYCVKKNLATLHWPPLREKWPFGNSERD
jgi:hypothetical protein